MAVTNFFINMSFQADNSPVVKHTFTANRFKSASLGRGSKKFSFKLKRSSSDNRLKEGQAAAAADAIDKSNSSTGYVNWWYNKICLLFLIKKAFIKKMSRFEGPNEIC